MKRLLYFLGIAAIVIVASYFFYRYVPDNEKPLVFQCTTGVTMLVAVLYALYGEYFKTLFDPIKLTIEVPKENNSGADIVKAQGDDRYTMAYWHHLVVVNETKHRKVENCRVWLKKIYVLNKVLNNNSKWEEKQIFAVPRLMNWAPSEWEPEKRTFCTTQVFDLGQKFIGNDEFLITVNPSLGGNIKLRYSAGETIKVCLFITADNYQLEKEFYFDIEIPSRSLASLGEVVPAKVTSSSKP